MKTKLLLFFSVLIMMPMIIVCGRNEKVEEDSLGENSPEEEETHPPSDLIVGRPDYCGIWGIWGGEAISRVGRPWYKGTVVTAGWDEVEPQPEHFVWEKLDAQVRQAVANDLSIMIMVYHGNVTPGWVYEHGVPKVTSEPKIPGAPGREGQEFDHPYYLDPDFKPLLTRLIQMTAAHIAAYPAQIREKIVGVQCPTGKTGDPQPYMGTPKDPRYNIDPHGKEWVDWTLGMFEVYQAAYKEASPRLFLLFKGPEPESTNWLLDHIPDSWRKPNTIAQGYQFNMELGAMADLYPLTRYPRADGVVIRTRGELDETTKAGENWFNAAPVWNVYWAGLWNLTYGIDIWNQINGTLQDSRFVPAFEFVSRYAGYKSAAESPGAWVALRDGLDCEDTRRFPESQFGPVGPNQPSENVDRYRAIAEAYASYGATLDDPEKVSIRLLDTRDQRGLNDVGYRIWPGNYGMFLEQYDPGGTSQGWWRVGSKDQPYGRFARGFDHARGKDAMHFRFEQGFFDRDEPAGSRAVVVRVVYFDQGNGQWAIRYDSADDAEKTALVVSKTNSGVWKEVLVILEDGQFTRRGPHDTDLSLVNMDDDDDIFHMIEVRRTNVH